MDGKGTKRKVQSPRFFGRSVIQFVKSRRMRVEKKKKKKLAVSAVILRLTALVCDVLNKVDMCSRNVNYVMSQPLFTIYW